MCKHKGWMNMQTYKENRIIKTSFTQTIEERQVEKKRDKVKPADTDERKIKKKVEYGQNTY